MFDLLWQLAVIVASVVMVCASLLYIMWHERKGVL